MKDLNQETLINEVDNAIDNGKEIALDEPATVFDEAENNQETVGEFQADETAESDENEQSAVVNDGRAAVYRPRFTEVSEHYRRRGDAKIRDRFGIKAAPQEEKVDNPDEIKLDPTAEFDADISGAEGAKTPENIAVDESDESINVMKFATSDDELEAEAQKQREEIQKLLDTELKSETASEEAEEEVEPNEEIEAEPEIEEYELPDPDADELKVYEFVEAEPEAKNSDELESSSSGKDKKHRKTNEREFSNPIQRDSIKDSFLDSLISIRIRMVASFIFALALLVLEVLCASKVLRYNLVAGSAAYASLGIIDFLLATCVFIMAAPELIRAIKDLVGKTITPDLLPIPLFVLFGLHLLTVALSGVRSYALFGLLFAAVTIPVLVASYYRTKADFIGFKMIAQPEDKQVIDLKNTRDLGVENKALDGAVDEYKSKLSRTYAASFISDFFKNSESPAMSAKSFGILYGIPFGIAFVAGVVAYFLSWSFVTGMMVFTLVAMLGCPAFSIISGKVSFFHSQRAALLTDSTAIGEDAYQDYSEVDVFAFDDTDIFGPEDVNLKRFMLYGDRENMEKVMRQMCALFAAVGGPLDYMFSEIIDNRVRHKTASNLIIEDDGICGEVAGRKICAGSEEYMRRNGIAIPQAATGRESSSGIDTIKIMYAAEDGEVTAKFYIRYSFSEEFTMTIPSLRESGITPLVYTRDPNVSVELLSTLSAGNGNMRVVKLYNPVDKDEVPESRASARMVTYGDRLDAASMIVLAKKNKTFTNYLRFAELCTAGIGIVLAITLSFIVGDNLKALPLAALWQIATCVAVRVLSKMVFLKESKKKGGEQ